VGTIKAIRTEADYSAALARVDALMDAEPGTADGEELDVLADLVEHYEEKHVPMGFPTALAAIQFRMEQAGLTQRDLVPLIGSRAKVSELLSGKRKLTMPMARALYEHLGVPAEGLLQGTGPKPPETSSAIPWEKFPLRAMAKLGWIPKGRIRASRAESCLRDLIHRAGGLEVANAALFRKSEHPRTNAKTDPYALEAWCWQVLAAANENRPAARYRPGAMTLETLRELARLSWSEKGPQLAKEFLARRGVPLIIMQHLPKTYLDGAALKLADGTPVVALTLRYDRLDNFWFCLLHELAHVARHIDDGDTAFLDDLSLRDVRLERQDPKEQQADAWAEEALIPGEVWERSTAREIPSPTAVINLASQIHVHPAIVAGRIRHERRNFRMLSHFVGTGEVRRHFDLRRTS